MIEKVEEEKVINFFYEHPIHDFTSKQIAEYLRMNQDILEEILEKMFLNNDLEETTRYKASKKLLKKIYTDVLMNIPNKIKSEEFVGNDYTKKLDCGCTIFGDDAGWHYSGFCKEHQKMIDEARKEDEESE